MRQLSLKKYQELLIEKFKLINKEFQNNNIFWWAHSGTLLGMIRENGMIPWDDDIDMGMTYKEYYENRKIIEQIASKYNMKILDNQDKTSGHYPIKILTDEYVIVKWNNQMFYVQPHIDIMLALPKFTTSPFIHKLNCTPWQIATNITVKRRHELIKNPNIYIGNKVVKVSSFIGWIYSLGYYFIPKSFLYSYIKKRYKKSLKINKWDEVQFWIGEAGNAWVFSPSKMVVIKVWNEEINISKNYEDELTTWFGNNWKIQPSEKNKVPHHLLTMKINSLHEIKNKNN